MMSMRGPEYALSLRANFFWNIAGTVIYNLCQWGVLLLVAKLLTAGALGEYTLALAITAPIVIFTNLGLRPAQATDVRQEFQFADYFGLRSLSSVVALSVIILAAAVADFGTQTALAIVLVGLAKIIESQSNLLYGLCQQFERMDFVAKSMIMRGPVSLVTMAGALYLSGQLAVAILAQAMVWLCVFLLYDLRIGRRLVLHGMASADDAGLAAGYDGWRAIRPRWEIGRLSRLTWLVLPLGFVGLLGSLYMNAPRYFIAEQLGLEQLGYFGAIMYILVAGNYVIQALGQAAVARLARNYSAFERSKFVVLLLKLAGVGAVLGALGLALAVVAGGEILTILYTADYAAYSDVFVLMMIAALIRFTASMLQYGITAARRFRIHLANQTLVTVAAFAASYFLILEYGLIGAGYAVIVASALYLLSVVFINIWLVHGLDRNGGN